MPLVSKPFGDIITFTRASSATYFDATGTLQTATTDAPRFDYNPSTLAAQGLLIEEARTNLVLQSQDFATTWTNSDSSESVNAATAPDGTLTADEIIENNATASHGMGQSGISYVSGITYTFSVFAKANSRSIIQIANGSGAFSALPYANFNLSTGVVSATGGGATATIQDCGNGWYRCVMTATADATLSSFVFLMLQTSETAVRLASYLGDGTSSLYLWGAQVEAGAFPTSYTPTTTTAVTRAADVASVNTLSPWFNSAEYTVYAEFQRDTTSGAAAGGGATVPRIWTFSTAATSAQIQARLFSSTGIEAVTSGSPQGYAVSTWAEDTVVKTAVRYQVDNFAIDTNLGSLGTDTSAAAVTGSDQFTIGQARILAANGYLNGWMRRLTYYPRALSDAELAAITT